MDIKPLPPSFLGIYNLSTSDLRCNAPYIVNNFLSIACSSFFLQLTNAAEYLNRYTAQDINIIIIIIFIIIIIVIIIIIIIIIIVITIILKILKNIKKYKSNCNFQTVSCP